MTFTFLSAIYDTFANLIGEQLARLIVNQLYLYLILISVFILLVLILRRFNHSGIKKFVIFTLLFVSFSYFFLLNPYYRGERLIYLKQFGNSIVSSIEEFRKKNLRLPDKVTELYPNEISQVDLSLAEKILRYNVFRKDELNKPYTKLGQTPFENDYYTITIYEDFMGFYYLRYDKTKNAFELSDD